MPVRSAYEIPATTTDLGIVQEGYLYEGSEPNDTQYLIHQVTQMEPGRAFILFDHDDPTINTANRQAQVVRFSGEGYTPGPLLPIGLLDLTSAGSCVDGAYLGDGLVLIATGRSTNLWFHLFRVAADDTITLIDSLPVPVPVSKFYWVINVEALGTPGQAICATGTGQTTNPHARFIKLAAVDDQLTVVSDVQEPGIFEPVTHPAHLSGDRLVYFGRYGSSAATLKLFNANVMATILDWNPTTQGYRSEYFTPATPIDDNRVFMLSRSGIWTVPDKCILIDFTDNTFDVTELPSDGFPTNTEKAADAAVWFDPTRPSEVTEWKYMVANEAVIRVLDADTLAIMAPIRAGSPDDNEFGIWHYKWQTGEMVGWVLVKSGKFNDDPDSFDYLMWENLSWELPIAADGSVLVVGSEYYDTDAQETFSGSIWLAVVGQPASEIISGPRNIKARFWQ